MEEAYIDILTIRQYGRKTCLIFKVPIFPVVGILCNSFIHPTGLKILRHNVAVGFPKFWGKERVIIMAKKEEKDKREQAKETVRELKEWEKRNKQFLDDFQMMEDYLDELARTLKANGESVDAPAEKKED